MLDIKWIRENPEKFDVAMIARNNKIRAFELLKFDEEKRKKTFLIQEKQADRNRIAREISAEKNRRPEGRECLTQREDKILRLMSESKKVNQELVAAENDF